MSTQTKTKTRQTKKSKTTTANIVWFEIPADDPERAKKFYSALFGWKINPFPGMPDYQHIDTGGDDDTPDGGLMPRKHPQQPITNYVNVPSVTKFAAKVEKLGGKVMKSKTAVPQMGYFAICRDTENNEFAIWERNDSAT
jgi:hypothetical protein